MRHIAVIGSGPAGYYSAEALQKSFGENVRIDIIDRLPVPYGLIRFGVAPDHQSIKAVAKRYEKVALGNEVRFVGNVAVGRDISIAELAALYDAVILATGAPDDRPLDIPGGAMVDSSWAGDRMNLSVQAMGQEVRAIIDVEEKLVRLQLDLPPMLSFFGKKIEALIRHQGTQMLEDKSGGRKS